MKNKVATLETEESSMVMNTRQGSGDWFKGSDTYQSMFGLCSLSLSGDANLAELFGGAKWG